MRRSVKKLSNLFPASCFLRLNDTVAQVWLFVGATYFVVQSGVLRGSVVRRWRPWEYLVYLTSFITDISHKIIYLLSFCLSGKRTLERKVTVLSNAAPFGCEIGRLPIRARFVAGVRHDSRTVLVNTHCVSMSLSLR